MLNIFKQLTEQLLDPDQLIRKRFVTFKGLLNSDRQSHHLLAEIEKIHYNGTAVDISRLRILFDDLSDSVGAMVDSLHDLAPGQYRSLKEYHRKIDFYGRFALAAPQINATSPYILSLDKAYRNDLHVGGKGFHLSELKNILHLPVPDGFILTTSAWNLVVETNNLRERIDRQLAEVKLESTESLQKASEKLSSYIANCHIPDEIIQELDQAASRITAGRDNVSFAVRSSAVAEDSHLSFAGQYLSLLNIPQKMLLAAYRKVLASKYTPEAMLYRILNGLDDEAIPMAVLVLEMVDARTSGVTTSSMTAKDKPLQLRIHRVSGLGDKLMGGETVPEIIEVRINNGVPHIQGKSDDTNISQLAVYCEKINNFYGTPQEIEWSSDRNGSLYLLQSRTIREPAEPVTEQIPPDLSNLPILFEGGETGGSGIVNGTVFKMPANGPLSAIPDGSILVCETTPPSLVSLLPRLVGVIARYGSGADHFSSVAREFGIPVLLQAGSAIDTLEDGMEIMLHSDLHRVYSGAVELPQGFQVKRQLPPGSSVGKALKMVIDFISPLSLRDPGAKNFKPEGCRSLHDIIRFVHEKAVQAMFLHNPDSFFRKPKTVQLISDIPLQVFLIDVGGGLASNRADPLLARDEDITSRPFSAFWRGLTHRKINWRDRQHFDWASYDSVALAGGISRKSDSALSSYCLLSEEYLNVNMRFGYHFTLLDCFCGKTAEENYILMRFAGGGGSAAGKDLRLTFIATILTRLGFSCEQQGEMLDSRLMRYDRQKTEEKMDQVGRLLGAVRLLDMVINDAAEIPLMVESFFNGTYDFSNE